ncbi:MAG: glycosyltransferase family 25 protein [Gammaproteobacteria bacterium]|nr:glycosyltransferase family 25 protein [Gammaproteobacteria bacterium]
MSHSFHGRSGIFLKQADAPDTQYFARHLSESLSMRYQIYLLNRAEEKTRLEHFRIQAGRLRQSFARIDAVNADQVQVSSELSHYDETNNAQHYYRSLTMSEIATYISHRFAWQRMLDDDVDFAIVLEDDVLLANSFAYLARTIAELEQPWHVLKLAEPYARVKSKGIERCGAATLVRYPDIPLGTSAYVITREGAEAMLRWSEGFYRPLDVDFQWAWQPGLKVRGIRPYPVQVSHRLGRAEKPVALMRKHQVRRVVALKEGLKYRWQRRLQNVK